MKVNVYGTLFALIISLHAHGEDPVGGQFDDLNLPQDQASSNEDQNQNPSGLVNAAGGAQAVSGLLVDSSQIQDNSAQNAVRGRREKTEDSISKGNQGVAAAIAAGTMLTAAGIPLLPPPTTPRGVALLTMAGLEFAQAGATGGVTSQNTSGRNTLRDGTPEGSQSEAVQNAIKEIDTPAFRQALADNGVNSDAFLADLTSGNLTNFADVQRALGVTEEFTPEQIAQAQAEASGILSGGSFAAKPEGNGTVDTARITADDSVRGKPGSEGNVSSISYNNLVNNTPNGAEAPESASLPAQEEAALLKEAQALAQKDVDRLKELGVGDSIDVDKLIQKYLGKLKKEKAGKKGLAQKLAGMSREELASIGIKKLRDRQNIFGISRRTYRTYGNWRERERQKARMAQLRQLRAARQ